MFVSATTPDYPRAAQLLARRTADQQVYARSRAYNKLGRLATYREPFRDRVWSLLSGLN
jgi:hypothetical protein